MTINLITADNQLKQNSQRQWFYAKYDLINIISIASSLLFQC